MWAARAGRKSRHHAILAHAKHHRDDAADGETLMVTKRPNDVELGLLAKSHRSRCVICVRVDSRTLHIGPDDLIWQEQSHQRY